MSRYGAGMDTPPLPPANPAPSFTCPRCLATSYHPKDLENGYCGACCDFTGVPQPPVVSG